MPAPLLKISQERAAGLSVQATRHADSPAGLIILFGGKARVRAPIR